MKLELLKKIITNQESLDFIENIPKNLENKLSIHHVEKNKTVILKGNKINKIYIHLSGQMKVRNEFENGFIYDFALIDPVAYIGVMETMADKNIYTSTLETISPCILLEISKDNFKRWLIKDSKLSLKVLSFISKIMYEQSVKSGEELAYPALIVLTKYLVNIFEKENKENLIINKGREELASLLGFSVRTINRNIKILRDEDLIRIEKRMININKKEYFKLKNKLK